MNSIGCCKFCGQIGSVVTGEDLTEDMIGHLVTMQCRCDEAREYQKIEQKKTYAEGNINKILEEDGDTIRQICLGMVDALARQTITKVSVTTLKGIRVMMTGKANSIKIERIETIKESMED